MFPDGTPPVRIRIRTEIAKGGRAGEAFLPDALGGKLRRYWTWKAARLESLAPATPLLPNQSGARISKRRIHGEPVNLAENETSGNAGLASPDSGAWLLR